MTAVQSMLHTNPVRHQLRGSQRNRYHWQLPYFSCRYLPSSSCSTRTLVGDSSRTAATPAATGSISPDKATEPLETQSLTPRQRRLAQQRRKWEEAQQQRKPRSQGSSEAPTSSSASNSQPASQSPRTPSSSHSPFHTQTHPTTTTTIPPAASSLPASRSQAPHPAPPHANPITTLPTQQKRKANGSSANAPSSSKDHLARAPDKAAVGRPSVPTPSPRSLSRPPTSPKPASNTISPYTLQHSTANTRRTPQQPSQKPPTASSRPSTNTDTSATTKLAPSPSSSLSSSSNATITSASPLTNRTHSVTLPTEHPSDAPHTQLPDLFSAAADGPDTPDLASLPTPQLVALAERWAQDIVDWERQRLEDSHRSKRTSSGDPLMEGETDWEVASALSGHHGGVTAAGHHHGCGLQQQTVADEERAVVAGPQWGGEAVLIADVSGGQSDGAGEGDGDWRGLRRQLPAAVVSRLACLTAAVDTRVAAGSLGHQELADLAWSVAHYDRAHAMRVLMPVMDVPFAVLPRFMPEMRLEDFMREVELRRDVIYLDDGTRAVEEARLTGWQSDIGATFRYSGKEMQPQGPDLTPAVRQVRDALSRETGVKYDSVLINYYADGKCGMRYHVDPLYDRWTPNSAVVSLGDTRTFIFRAINDFNMRWHYRVRNGDVVLMYGDCQERLQHCVRVERHAADAGPRMSLVFKERRRGPDGAYLLD